jgi:hypothetical protein
VEAAACEAAAATALDDTSGDIGDEGRRLNEEAAADSGGRSADGEPTGRASPAPAQTAADTIAPVAFRLADKSRCCCG